MKWATKYQNKETNNICFLYVKRNPFKKGMNQKRYFEDVIDIEFEGHKFMAPRDYEELLDYCYSKDWRKYPNVKAQINHHFPGLIDLDNVD